MFGRRDVMAFKNLKARRITGKCAMVQRFKFCNLRTIARKRKKELDTSAKAGIADHETFCDKTKTPSADALKSPGVAAVAGRFTVQGQNSNLLPSLAHTLFTRQSVLTFGPSQHASSPPSSHIEFSGPLRPVHAVSVTEQ